MNKVRLCPVNDSSGCEDEGTSPMKWFTTVRKNTGSVADFSAQISSNNQRKGLVSINLIQADSNLKHQSPSPTVSPPLSLRSGICGKSIFLINLLDKWQHRCKRWLQRTSSCLFLISCDGRPSASAAPDGLIEILPYLVGTEGCFPALVLKQAPFIIFHDVPHHYCSSEWSWPYPWRHYLL